MLLHKGTVAFEETIATDVTGTVKRALPPPESGEASSFDGGRRRRKKKPGTGLVSWTTGPGVSEACGGSGRFVESSASSSEKVGGGKSQSHGPRLVRFSAADVTKIDGACGNVGGRAHALRPMDSVQFDVVRVKSTGELRAANMRLLKAAPTKEKLLGRWVGTIVAVPIEAPKAVAPRGNSRWNRDGGQERRTTAFGAGPKTPSPGRILCDAAVDDSGADVAASTRVVGKIVEFSAQDVAAMCLVASVTAAKAADALESEFQSKEHRELYGELLEAVQQKARQTMTLRVGDRVEFSVTRFFSARSMQASELSPLAPSAPTRGVVTVFRAEPKFHGKYGKKKGPARAGFGFIRIDPVQGEAKKAAAEESATGDGCGHNVAEGENQVAVGVDAGVVGISATSVRSETRKVFFRSSEVRHSDLPLYPGDEVEFFVIPAENGESSKARDAHPNAVRIRVTKRGDGEAKASEARAASKAKREMKVPSRPESKRLACVSFMKDLSTGFAHSIKQSKGPDGTCGFPPGWRPGYPAVETPETGKNKNVDSEIDFSVNAPAFVPRM
jgi:hypothetical protein